MEYNYNEDSFHDNLIHGVIFYSDVGEFSSDLAFDIDYIEQWRVADDGTVEFVIFKALLKFTNVTDLKLLVDWGSTNNSLFSGHASGLYINKIIKEKITSPISEDYFLWRIETNSSDSNIFFGASNMFLEITGKSNIVNRQYLLKKER
ncbi:hypothetical protein CDR68_05100 [Salmonella enterica]|nr:hypothetical protein [Salmonella enterica]